MQEKLNAFERLLNIMDELREKCPWDRKQTMQSLSSLTVEEVYELIDEIEKSDYEGVKEELGDLLLHAVFYAKIASEQGLFTITDSINSICDKLIRRHPHIYSDVKVTGADDVKKNWEQIKLAEGKKSLLAGVPNALPSLIKAQRMQEKAAQVGFDWDSISDLKTKIYEEIEEFDQIKDNPEELTQEFGDLLFSLINYARVRGIDANRALDLTNRKFKKRFEYIEQNAHQALSDMSLAEMDLLWEEAKSDAPK